MYYIKRNDGFYYCNNKTNHWTNLIDKAQRFKTAEAATNFALISFKGTINYTIVGEDKKEACAAPVATNEIFSKKDFSSLLSLAGQFGKMAEKIPQMLTYYNNTLSEQDKLQEDLLHKIEFTPSFRVITHIKLNKKLKQCRLDRRDAKNAVYYLSAINATTSLPKLLEVHQKNLQGQANQKYAPRIAPELFKKEKMK